VLSESVASAKVLLLVNYRPEYRSEWGQKTYYTQLRLTPLGQAEAEVCFLKAINIAQKQQAKSLELRAVMSLARLRQQQALEYESRTTSHATRNTRQARRSTLGVIRNL
jgi:hypothetical protein